MAAIRTQREIRQKAPVWLATLLVTNLVIMAFNARDDGNNQRHLRVWMQAAAAPLQNFSTRASWASGNLVRQIINFRSTAAENEQLRQRLAQTELELKNAYQTTQENERLKALLG